MNAISTIKIVFSFLRSYKLRTFLAVFGVFLGTLSLILVLNISNSLKYNVLLETSKFGDNIIIVAAGQVVRTGRSQTFGVSRSFDVDDAKAIYNSSPEIIDYTPYIKRIMLVSFRENNITTNIIGINERHASLRKLEFTEGTFFSEDDINKIKKVCIIGSEVRDKLFEDIDPVGKNIRLNKSSYKIIGVQKEKGSDLSRNNMDDLILIPYSTFMIRLANIGYIDGVEIKLVDLDIFKKVKKTITTVLRKRHKLNKDADDDFTIINPVDAKNLKTETVDIVSFLGKITAVISYIIGGLGIFSIMLLVLGIRRTEIGIRRAVGARKRDIFRQFLLESSFIGFIGSFFGIIFSIIASLIVFNVGELPLYISIQGIILSIFSSMCIGMIAGVYPAYLASKLDPIKSISE